MSKERKVLKKRKNRILITMSIIAFVMYLLYLLYLTLLSPFYGRGDFHRSVNLIPFKTIFQYLMYSNNLQAIIINLLGNIAAFTPMGLLIPIISNKYNSLLKILPIILLSTFIIESMQYMMGVGTSDIDDIILNVLGGIIGFIVYIVIEKSINFK